MSVDYIIGQIFSSNIDGDFIVLENMGHIYERTHNDYYKIQFLDSGNISHASKYCIEHRSVKDPFYGIDISRLQYSNNYGAFRVIEFIKSYDDKKNVMADIEFVATGTRKRVFAKHIKSGDIKDENATFITPLDTTLLQPRIREWRIDYKLHEIYKHMESRCLDQRSDHYAMYGKLGIKICDRWLNSWQVFIQDARLFDQFQKFYRYPTIYQIDKDYKQLSIPKEQRVYAPETCMFLHYYDNANIRYFEAAQIRTSGSKYYGVEKIPNGTFTARIYTHGVRRYLASFTNEIAAASCYNYWHRYYHQYELFPLFNNIDEMPPTEFMRLYTVVNPGINLDAIITNGGLREK